MPLAFGVANFCGVRDHFCAHFVGDIMLLLLQFLDFVSRHGRMHNVLSIPTHNGAITDTTTYLVFV